ncbi:hypothetical protein [Aquabacterium sp.]|uniref:hypothetical protein n=1 Tax=Aquabacterium sp. TaxID=1872578 RepID=UPI00378330B3
MNRMFWMGGLLLALAVPLAQAQGAASAATANQGVVEKVEKAVEHGAKTAASAVAHGAKVAASGVERGVKAAASGVQRGAKAAASGVQRGVHATAKAVDSVAHKVVGSASAASAASKPAD